MNPHQSSQTSNENTQDSTQKQDEVLNPKRFSEEEKQLYQKAFSLNIKRKPYKRGAIRNVSKRLIDSFYPTTKVSYAAMERRLLTQFDRGNRQTVLAYLGRPAYRQIQKMEHTIETQNGSRAKSHTFTRKMKEIVGYVQKLGYATLYDDRLKGETYFILHHKEQVSLDNLVPLALPPTETFEESALREALAFAKCEANQKSTLKKYLSCNRAAKNVSKKAALQSNTNTNDGEERETYTREINFEMSESNLLEEEKRLFGLYDSVTEALR